ncbi:MAG: hypothetical protein VX335_02280 [Pseudomonadota bacterium]|nr:hypothetical protein [Pseudomonadota bacterium]
MFFPNYSMEILYKLDEISLVENKQTIKEICKKLKVLFNPGELEKKPISHSIIVKSESHEEDKQSLLSGLDLKNNPQLNSRAICKRLGDINNWDQVYLNKSPKLKKTIINHGLFDGVESSDIDNIITIYNNLATIILKLKLKALKLEQHEEDSKNIRSAILLLSSLCTKLKVFRGHLVENMLNRLEIIAKYGFIKNPISYDLLQSETQQARFNFELAYEFDNSWNNDKFNQYYEFVLKSLSYSHKFKLAKINWGFGKVVLRDDGSLILYPEIFKKGELLLSKPWFSFIFKGKMLVYGLFSNPYKHISMLSKVKRALSLCENLDIHNYQEVNTTEIVNMIAAIKLLEKEGDYIENEKNKLWSYWNSYAYGICSRWQDYLYEKKIKLIQHIMFITKAYINDYLNKGEHSLSPIITAVPILLSSSYLIDIDTESEIKQDLAKAIAKKIVSAILCFNYSSKKAFAALQTLFQGDMAKLLQKILGAKYFCIFSGIIDSISPDYRGDLTSIRKVINDFVKNIEVLDLVQSQIQSQAIADISAVEAESLLTNAISVLKGFSKKQNENIYDINNIDKYPNIISLLKSLKSSDVKKVLAVVSSMGYKYNLSLELARCPYLFNYIKTAVSEFFSNLDVFNPGLIDLVIDFAEESYCLEYGLQLAKHKLKSGESFHKVIHNSFVEKIRKINVNLASSIVTSIEELCLDLLKVYADNNDLEAINFHLGSFADIKSSFKGKGLQNFLHQIIASGWSKSREKIVLSLSETKQRELFLRNTLENLLLTDMNEEVYKSCVASLLTILDSANGESCFGADNIAKLSLINILNAILDSEIISIQKLDLLSSILKNDKFCDFYELNEYKQTWKTKVDSLTLVLRIKDRIVEVSNKPNLLKCSEDLLDELITDLIAQKNQSYSNISTTGVSDKLVDVIWQDMSNLIKSNMLSGNIGMLDSYESKLLRLKKLEYQDGLALDLIDFMLWLIRHRSYISATPLRVYNQISIDAKVSSWLNSMSTYLFNIGCFHESLAADFEVRLRKLNYSKDLRCIISIWKSQRNNIEEICDPFVIDTEQALSMDNITDVVVQDHVFEILYRQIEAEYHRFNDKAQGEALSAQDIHSLRIYLDNLLLVADSKDESFKLKVSSLIQNIRSTLSKTVSTKLKVAKISSLNQHATLFNNQPKHKELLCNNIQMKNSY